MRYPIFFGLFQWPRHRLALSPPSVALFRAFSGSKRRLSGSFCPQYSEFDNREELEVVVSDLTYVRVGQKWHYICVLIDLFNREIIGQSSGPNKTAELVTRAFASVRTNLHRLKLFHTDRGSEFKNKSIDEALDTFGIERSLSAKGTPYDNAVAEAAFKTLKTEFILYEQFASQEALDLGLFDYVNWYNNVRIHGSLGYQTPAEYKKNRAIHSAS